MKYITFGLITLLLSCSKSTTVIIIEKYPITKTYYFPKEHIHINETCLELGSLLLIENDTLLLDQFKTIKTTKR